MPTKQRRRKESSKIAVSFCNQPFTRELVLGLLDPDTGDFRWIDIQHCDQVCGAAGIATADGLVFVGIQVGTPSSRLHIYDEESFELLEVYEFMHVRDIHSLLWLGSGRLLAVSTGTDELYELHIEGAKVVAERPIWRLPGTFIEAGDQCHVNSATYGPDGLAVSYCRTDGAMSLAGQVGGGIALIEDFTLLATGLAGPHSLSWLDDDYYYCNAKGFLCRLSGASVEIGGFGRGLCELNGKLLAGSSGKRWRSRSTGRVSQMTRAEFVSQGSWVTVLDKVTLEPLVRFDLRGLGIEIYELHPVRSDFGAKFVIECDPRAERAAALEYELHMRERF